MKKKMFVVIGVVTALLVFFSVMLLVKKPGIGNMQTSSDAEKTEDSFSYSRESSPGVLSDPDADALLSTLGSMGESYTLHSRDYEQGEEKEEEAPALGWDGDMTVLVKSAQLLPFDESAQYCEGDPRSSWSTYAGEFQDPRVLRLAIQLENIDAHNRNGVQYQFTAFMFQLSAYEDLIPQNWLDENYIKVAQRYAVMESYFDHSSDEKDYWGFELRPGESMDFTLEFLVDCSYLEQQAPFLAVSVSRGTEVGVLLDKITEGA